MVVTSWQQWLRSALSQGALHVRRKAKLPTLAGLEALEPRTLLTAPVVIDGSGNPNEDLAFPGTVATLGSDAEDDPLTYKAVATPTHGTLTFNATGVFSYTPSLNYSGPDSFTFVANDGTSDSNVGTYTLTVSPVDDGMKLVFPSGIPQVSRNSSPVRIDPAAIVADVDTAVDYANAQIRALISSGNTNGDYQKGRVGLKVLSQGDGPGLVNVVGTNIYYDGGVTPIATFTGGTLGRSLVIKFRSAATEQSVNAVLKQISLVASKKATSNTVNGQVGIRLVDVTVSAGGQKTLATKSVSVI